MRIPYLDNCPKACGAERNLPHHVRAADRGQGIRADYRCRRCGHTWFTGWQRENPPSGLEAVHAAAPN